MSNQTTPKKTVKLNVARAERLLRMYSGLKLKLKSRTENLYSVHVESNPDVQITVERSKLRNELSLRRTGYKLTKLFATLASKSDALPKPKRYTHDYCICFSVESDMEDCGMLTCEQVKEAALSRIADMNPSELVDALEYITTIENR